MLVLLFSGNVAQELNAVVASSQGQTTLAEAAAVAASVESAQGQTTDAVASQPVNAAVTSTQGQTSAATAAQAAVAAVTSSQGQSSGAAASQPVVAAVTSSQGQTSGATAAQAVVATVTSSQGQTSTAATPASNSAPTGLRRWLIQYYTDEQAKRDAERKKKAAPAAKPSPRRVEEPEETFEELDLRAFVRQSENFAVQLQELSDATQRSYWLSQNALKLEDSVRRASLAAAEAQEVLRQQEDEEFLAIMDFMR